LAAEELTMEEGMQTLNRVLGKRAVVHSVTPQEAMAAGLSAGWVRSQEWSNEISYGVEFGTLGQWDVPLTSFEDCSGVIWPRYPWDGKQCRHASPTIRQRATGVASRRRTEQRRQPPLPTRPGNCCQPAGVDWIARRRSGQ
jgi:hypothetical protein